MPERVASGRGDDRLLGALAETARAHGLDPVEVHPSLPSTQDHARALARAGAARALVLALEQPAGRGRDGRAWSSPPGGLWFSVVGPGAARPLVPITLPVAVATVDALASLCPGLALSIKWPNDVLVKGRKLSGVLADAEGTSVVLGVGINVAVDLERLPPEVRSRAATLASAADDAPSLERVLDAVLAALLPMWARWVEATPAAARAWVERAWAKSALRSRPFVVHAPGRPPFAATAEGLAPDGALLVRAAPGAPIERISSAHLALGEQAPEAP